VGVFVTLHGDWRFAPAAAGESHATKDPGRCRRAYSDGRSDLPAGPALMAQDLDAERDRRPCLTRVAPRPTRAIHEPRDAVTLEAEAPLRAVRTDTPSC